MQKKALLRALTTVMTPAALLLLSACGQTAAVRTSATPQVRTASTRPAPTASRPASPVLATQDTTLSDAQVLQRLSRLYRYQSEILTAQSQNNGQGVDGLFELAMADLGRLARQDGIRQSAHGQRFNEVYRSLVTEYERYYHVSPDDFAVQRGDIFEIRADVFAALNDALQEPELADVVLPELRPVAQATIPMTRHPLVEASIAYLLRSPERTVNGWINRAETYFPMIEQIFHEEGVPDELKYLAMIESGLNPRVTSSAQAAGMWQFIRATGTSYGLDVDTYVDERMDPEKATRAAARHLRDLYAQYGNDWHLAIAGYNCSPRCINNARNAARRRGVANPTFWDIYQDLPRETRNYVPMFIAASLVASNADQIEGIAPVQPGPRFEYDVVPVRGSLSLARVAEMAGTTEDVVRALNPSLRRPQLPATNSTFALRLPVGSGAQFFTAYSGLSSAETSIAEANYTVGSGETLTRIARQYGVSEDALRQRNGLPTGEAQTGMRLTIPVAATAIASAAVNGVQTVRYTVRPRTRIPTTTLAARTTTPRPPARPAPRATPTPERVAEAPRPAVTAPIVTVSERDADAARVAAARREADASRARELARAREAERVRVAEAARAAEASRSADVSRASSATSNTRTVYTVQRGDNLSEVAQRHGVTMGQIRQWNRLSSSSVRSGQRLVIFGAAAPEAARPARAAAPEPVRTRTSHTVARGQTLSEISRETGVSMDDLREWNDLSANGAVRSGQRLRLTAPPASSRASAREAARPAAREAAKPSSHTVRSGDNLTSIARQYGISVADLRRLNSLTGDNLRAGQRLKVK